MENKERAKEDDDDDKCEMSYLTQFPRTLLPNEKKKSSVARNVFKETAQMFFFYKARQNEKKVVIGRLHVRGECLRIFPKNRYRVT